MERIIVGETGWSNDDNKTDPGKLIEISEQMKSVLDIFSKEQYADSEDMCVLIQNISSALDKWTGATYVGVRKDEKLESAYSLFYETFHDLLFCWLDIEGIYHIIAKKMLYSGDLYRYLGHASGTNDYYSRVEPEYNNLWVSWSKDDVRDNGYLGSKLYGSRTLLKCKTGYMGGIDLTGWDEVFETSIVRANESEVVFPTIKDNVIDVIYYDMKKRYSDDE
ncbi:MAG: hypothetical protein K6E27_08155 [Eubacterium sp.]|nr:hypothetical protein [Eubacterium sp.]